MTPHQLSSATIHSIVHNFLPSMATVIKVEKFNIKLVVKMTPLGRKGNVGYLQMESFGILKLKDICGFEDPLLLYTSYLLSSPQHCQGVSPASLDVLENLLNQQHSPQSILYLPYPMARPPQEVVRY
ncbi:hypothetical protein Tco_0951789 [Tanacetum coccineum]|uniref:Uncharacterized protein n=1 Tax=Tanacetum coccineum TaxID=301880 RepID=A0ABQ5E1W4_9ASTR